MKKLLLILLANCSIESQEPLISEQQNSPERDWNFPSEASSVQGPSISEIPNSEPDFSANKATDPPTNSHNLSSRKKFNFNPLNMHDPVFPGPTPNDHR